MIIQLPFIIDGKVGLIHDYVLSHGIRLQHLVALFSPQNLVLGVFPDILCKQELLLLCHLLIIQMIFKARVLLVLVLLVIDDLNLVTFASKNVISFLYSFIFSLPLELEFVKSLLLDEIDIVIQILRNEYFCQVTD